MPQQRLPLYRAGLKTCAQGNQQLDDNNVGELQGKLAELSTNLSQIMELQRDLLPLRDRVAAVEKSNSETVITVNAKIEALGTAMDELANPLGR